MAHASCSPRSSTLRYCRYGLDLIVTAPSVVYKVEMNDGEVVDVDAPAKMADADRRQSVSEPYVDMEVFCPKEYDAGRVSDRAPRLAHARSPTAHPASPPSTTGTRGR